MASILELRSRIKSVNSTKKITKAQELIATSRITKAQIRVAASKPYAEEITKVLTELASASASLDHPLLNERPEPKRAAVLVVTSDRGMCGGYNSNVLKQAEELMALLRSEGKEPVVYVLGSKGLGYYTFRGRDIGAAWTGFSQDPGYSDAAKASRHLVELFMAGSGNQVAAPNGEGTIEGVDELHIVYTRFVSMLTQTPEVRRMAPLEVFVSEERIELGDDMLTNGHDDDHDNGPVADFSFEPEPKLLGALLEVRQHSYLLVASRCCGIGVGSPSYRHEGRDGQRKRTGEHVEPSGQPGSPGPDHPGNQRDRRRRQRARLERRK